MQLVNFSSKIAQVLVNKQRIRKIGVFCELGLIYIKNRSYNTFIDKEGFAFDLSGHKLERDELEICLNNKGLLKKLLELIISNFGYSYIDTFMTKGDSKINDNFISKDKDAVSIEFIDDVSFMSSNVYCMLLNFLSREKELIPERYSFVSKNSYKDKFLLEQKLDFCLVPEIKKIKSTKIPYFSNNYSYSIGNDIFGCDIEYHKDFEFTVLRYVRYIKNTENIFAYEFFRIYIIKNEMVSFVKDNNMWIQALPRNMANFIPSIVNIKSKDIFMNSSWEFLNKLKNNDSLFLGILPYCFLLDKNVEALYGLGFYKFTQIFVKHGLLCNNKLYEKEFIPFLSKEQKNLFKRVNFSKNQLFLVEDILPLNKRSLNLEENINYNYRFLYFLLDIMRSLESNGIIVQSIDDDSFKVIRDFAATSICSNHYPTYSVYVMDIISREKGLKSVISFFKYYLDVIPNIKTGDGYIKIQDFFRIIYDCLNMIQQLKNYDIHYDFKYKFDDFRDNGTLIKFHNELTDLINSIELKYNNEEYEKIKEGLLPYEYLDKEFCVIVPPDAVSLAKEGETLHHCVKTYINKVIDKETIILFIRKANILDKPFFTLEIKDNEVRQCHGLKNCNIDTVPNLKAFLKKYCKEKKVKFNSADNILAAD